MAENHVLLGRQTLSQSAASVTFNNIPQSGYTDLKLVASARSSAGGVGSNMSVQFNGSSTGFTYKLFEGDGSSAASYSGSTGYNALGGGNSSTANTFGNAEIYIPNYLSSNYKSFTSDSVAENNGSTGVIDIFASLWSNTAAISSITLTPASGNFVQYSTFSLYGIAVVGTTPTTAPKARGGDVITNDGTYWIHQFLSTGTFTPLTNLSCDYLVVAGGGGAASRVGGGGGAGGFRTATSQALTNGTAYTITVGAGGTGGAGGTNSVGYAGTKGTSSSIGSFAASGGGYGAYGTGSSGGSGGGGGVGSISTQGAGNEGGYTPVEGYRAGNITVSGNHYPSTGGGGASAAGADMTTANGGGTNGGAGASSSISGSSVTYAGGGGGGIYSEYGNTTYGFGGSGGGGNASANGAGTAGTVNTGGGGGGGGTNGAPSYAGGAGGSGIVIIRYAMA